MQLIVGPSFALILGRKKYATLPLVEIYAT